LENSSSIEKKPIFGLPNPAKLLNNNLLKGNEKKEEVENPQNPIQTSEFKLGSLLAEFIEDTNRSLVMLSKDEINNNEITKNKYSKSTINKNIDFKIEYNQPRSLSEKIVEHSTNNLKSEKTIKSNKPEIPQIQKRKNKNNKDENCDYQLPDESEMNYSLLSSKSTKFENYSQKNN
jgi:hypothetical protein